MRKMYLFMMVTLDGYFEGNNNDISWHNVDEEFNSFAVKQLKETSTIIFGRKTYEMMAQFWPSDYAIKLDPNTAILMNSYQKIVFSKKINKVNWTNTKLYKKDVAKIINLLKSEPGKDIAVFGSSDLSLTLLNEKLLDEIRIMINPVVLGSGNTLFKGLNEKLKLQLISNKEFKSGNVLLTYKVL